MPLLPGTPTSYSQSPEVSYSPAVVITASSVTLTRSELCLV